MEILPTHNLITLFIGSLENIVLLSNGELPNVDIFYIQYLKTSHCLRSYPLRHATRATSPKVRGIALLSQSVTKHKNHKMEILW